MWDNGRTVTIKMTRDFGLRKGLRNLKHHQDGAKKPNEVIGGSTSHWGDSPLWGGKMLSWTGCERMLQYPRKIFIKKKKKKTQERPDSRWMHVSEPSKQFSENKNLPERQRVVVPAGLAVPHQVRALLAQSEKRLRLRATEAPVIPPAENQEEWKWCSLLRCNSVCRASSYCLQPNKQANSGYVEDGRRRRTVCITIHWINLICWWVTSAKHRQRRENVVEVNVLLFYVILMCCCIC